jgi:hypothetical protein
MAEELDTTIADDKASEADFGAGFAGTEGKPDKAAAKPDKATTKPDAPQPAETPRAEETPEYVQVTAKEWNEIKAAAARTASYDQQFSKLFGTTGNLAKQINEQRAATTPAAAAAVAKKFEVPKEAFAAMERDFPELAAQTRAALEAALSGLPGPGGNDAHDPAKLESLLAQYHSKRELEVLEDQFPTWRTIVGAVDVTREQPDPNNAFRKWLGGKPADYQARVNGSESAQVIGRAIRLFQRETAAPAKTNGAPRNDARADRIRAAVQPRGDNAGAAAGKSENDEFLEGFNSR